jgi:membrane protein
VRGTRAVARLRTARERYGRHACSELAAALAYRVLFSLVPFIALLAAILDAVLAPRARADVVDWLLGAFPGTTVRDSVEHELAASGAITSLAGMIAFGTLIWTASGMTRSLRVALAVVWEAGDRLPFVRGKLRDIAALGVLAALLIAVFALSIVTQIAVQAGAGIGDALGFEGAAAAGTRAAELALTAAATFAALLLVYRFGAPVEVELKTAWPSALATAVVIDATVAGYAFYLVRIAGFDTIYGPLGAVLAFLALLYVTAALVLFGGELVAVRSAAGPLAASCHPVAVTNDAQDR